MTYKELHKKMRRQHSCLIVDFDGTLALRGERGPFDWHRVGEDEPNPPVIFAIRHLGLFSTTIIVSGRDESCRWQSEMWLHSQEITWHSFFMRPTGDNRPDVVIKKEIYDREIKDKFNVLSAWDDRPAVIRMWQAEGIFVFDVNNGKGEF